MFTLEFKGHSDLKRKIRATGRRREHIILKLIKHVLFSTCQVQCREGI